MPRDKNHLKYSHKEEYRQQVGLGAQAMIKRYGTRASREAAIRAAELDEAGRHESAALWREIAKQLQLW